MKVFRGLQHSTLAPACALTIGNFDGVHRGHQAMLALLRAEAAQRGVPSCVLTFEPHPRDYFAAVTGKQDLAPARIGSLRDKLIDLAALRRRPGGGDAVQRTPGRPGAAERSSTRCWCTGCGPATCWSATTSALVPGASGDYAMLDAAGDRHGLRRGAHEQLRGARTAGVELRRSGEALAARPDGGRGTPAGPPVPHLRPCGARPQTGPRTGFSDAQPALCALETGRQRHLRRAGAWAGRRPACRAWPIWASAHRSTRPTSTAAAYCSRPIAWTGPTGWGHDSGYGKIIRVELLHKLHDELKYDGLDALERGIARDRDGSTRVFRVDARADPSANHTRPNLAGERPQPAADQATRPEVFRRTLTIQ